MCYSSGTISHSVARRWSDFLRNVWHFPEMKTLDDLVQSRKWWTQQDTGASIEFTPQPCTVWIVTLPIKCNCIYLTFIKPGKAHESFSSNILLHNLVTHIHTLYTSKLTGPLKRLMVKLFACGCLMVSKAAKANIKYVNMKQREISSSNIVSGLKFGCFHEQTDSGSQVWCYDPHSICK